MPRKNAAQIKLSEHEEKILTQIKVGTHSAMHLKSRAAIVLLANSGESNNSIERKLGIRGETVTKWRDRYAGSHKEITKIETESPRKLRSVIESTLSDAPRPGAPATFTDEQVACILALACEEPKKSGLPFSHWTPALLQTEVIKRGIVESISAMHIGRFLKRKRLKAPFNERLAKSPHRRYGSIFS
jgi:transposase